MTTSAYYFGPATAPLFGCFHAPARTAAAKSAVLLCNAMGHEYMAAHRTVRQTAVRLARAGMPALRFDFFGAGDSAGDSAEGLPSRWVADIAVAVAELRKRHGAAGVSVVGFRLGATLALLQLQAPEASDVRGLVMCDPVISGQTYVDELTALQRERFGRADDDEVLGFPFTPGLRSELGAIDLMRTNRPRVRDLFVVESGEASDETRALVARLRDLGVAVEHRAFGGRPLWHEPTKSAVAADLVQGVVAWVAAHS